jgi:hypothetical protein
MSGEERGAGAPAPSVRASTVSLAVRWTVVLFLAIAPFRVASYGYLADDDVLRHAAKAVSGRSWSEILVLRPEVTMDSHPGWHALLTLVHRVTGADVHGLAVLSLLLTSLLLLLPPAFLLRRPEAWALAVFAFGALEQRIPTRFFSGRPFVLGMAALAVLCLLAPRGSLGRHGWRVAATVTALLAVVIWMEPSWHLYLLPVLACLLARRWRLAVSLLGVLGAAVLLAGVLHGNLFEFVAQSLLHTVLAFGTPAPAGTLALEFNPGSGSVELVLGLLLFLGWRHARGRLGPATLDQPVFLLAATGWLLGWLVLRFWSDWGAPALLVWLALELQEMLEGRLESGARRLAVAAVAGLGACLVLSANIRGQRYAALERPYLSLASPAATPFLPDPGGILYTDDMRLFYQLFSMRPTDPFRYVVGYEPGLMPPDDLQTFRSVVRERTPAHFAPWVRKMNPADRLILQSLQGQPPIPGLVWTQVSPSVWSGRVPAAAPRHR